MRRLGSTVVLTLLVSAALVAASTTGGGGARGGAKSGGSYGPNSRSRMSSDVPAWQRLGMTNPWTRKLFDDGSGPDSHQFWTGGPTTTQIWHKDQFTVPPKKPFEDEPESNRKLMGGGSGPDSHQFWAGGPAQIWHKDQFTVPPKKPFEDEPESNRKLLGGGSGPDSHQFWAGPATKAWPPKWRKDEFAVPKQPFDEAEPESNRRLLGGGSGPDSHQFWTGPATKAWPPKWRKDEFAVPKEPFGDEPESNRMLLSNGNGPDSHQFWTGGPSNTQIWHKDQFTVPPQKPFEDEPESNRKLLDGGSGPDSHQFWTGGPSNTQIWHKDQFTVPPKEPFEEEPESNRKLLGIDASNKSPGSHHKAGSSSGRLYAKRAAKWGPSTVTKVWHRNDLTDRIWQGDAARRLLGGGSGPDSWQFWGTPVTAKVWQKSPRRSWGPQSNRKLLGAALADANQDSGPASYRYRPKGGDPYKSRLYELLKTRPGGDAPAVPDESRFNPERLWD